MSLGSPNIKDAKVKFEIIKQDRDRKILVFKKQRRKNFRRKNGHKQDITFLKVLDIEVPGLTFPKIEAAKIEKVAKVEEVVDVPIKKKVVKKKTAAKVEE